jgi:hypothetical protein
MFAGDARDLYFQLVDAEHSSDDKNPGRYCPAAGSTLLVTLLNVDGAKQLAKVATQPFSGDSSIWKVAVGATDSVKGTIPLQFKLTEGGVVRQAYVPLALRSLTSGETS